jgi:hypothetical protein
VYFAWLAGLKAWDRYSDRLGLKRRARQLSPAAWVEAEAKAAELNDGQ